MGCTVGTTNAIQNNATKMTTICLENNNNNNASENDNHGEEECIVCWETNKTSACTTQENLPCCRHVACQDCMKSWIERYEQEGKDDVTCPYCRQKYSNEFLKRILGRKYDNNQRKQRPREAAAEAPIDDFTQTWFQENDAHQCTNCGMWMIQEDDGDETPTACICGFIYCWTCHDNGEDCDCSHCEFYDPLVGDVFSMEVASRFPVAGPEHFDDLNTFMEERKEAIYRYQEGDDDDDDEEEEDEDDESLVEEPVEGTELLVPLFADCCCKDEGNVEEEEEKDVGTVAREGTTAPTTEGVIIPAA